MPSDSSGSGTGGSGFGGNGGMGGGLGFQHKIGGKIATSGPAGANKNATSSPRRPGHLNKNSGKLLSACWETLRRHDFVGI